MNYILIKYTCKFSFSFGISNCTSEIAVHPIFPPDSISLILNPVQNSVALFRHIPNDKILSADFGIPFETGKVAPYDTFDPIWRNFRLIRHCRSWSSLEFLSIKISAKSSHQIPNFGIDIEILNFRNGIDLLLDLTESGF